MFQSLQSFSTHSDNATLQVTSKCAYMLKPIVSEVNNLDDNSESDATSDTDCIQEVDGLLEIRNNEPSYDALEHMDGYGSSAGFLFDPANEHSSNVARDEFMEIDEEIKKALNNETEAVLSVVFRSDGYPESTSHNQLGPAHMSNDEALSILESPFVNYISDHVVAVYPKNDTMGYIGHLHSGNIYLEVEIRGPNYSPEFVDDLFEDLTCNSLVVCVDSEVKKRSIHGGQLYCPSDILSNISRSDKSIRDIMNTLPGQLTHLLSSGVKDHMIDSKAVKSQVSTVLESVKKISEELIEKERLNDNCPARIELCFAEEFSHRQEMNLSAVWPSYNIFNAGDLTLNDCLMEVEQSEKYNWMKHFFETHLDPILRVLTLDQNIIHGLSAEAKTMILYCAEKLTRNLMNGFFQGLIHTSLKSLLHPCSSFCIPEYLSVELSSYEQTTIKLSHGMKSYLLPIKFTGKSKDLQQLVHKNLVAKKCILNLKGVVDFPFIFVTYTQKIWSILQQYSYPSKDASEIGFFDDPQFEILATLPADDFSEMLTECLLQCLFAYRETRTQIINEKKKRIWKNKKQVQDLFEVAPICVSELKSFPSGFLFLTSDKYCIQLQHVVSVISNNDMHPITNTGKFYYYYLS